jgi:3-oxoacyl-[acyl-carrier-protein] synthase III
MHHTSAPVEASGSAAPASNGSAPTSAPPVSIRIDPPVQLAAQPAGKSSSVFTLRRKTSSLLGVQIVGTGSYVPDNVVTNEDLRRTHGFDPEWIEQRSGILERRHAPRDQATSDLCVEAGGRALRAAGLRPQDIDLLVVGTFTPDHFCPSTACLVQHRLGLEVPAFDISAACSGFVYALSTAAQFVATGNARTAMVIGADTNSRIVNPTDQRTFPLFGDGAGAVILTRGEPHQGLICYQLGADGGGGALLVIPGGGTRQPTSPQTVEAGLQYVQMDGRSVFKWAVRALSDTIELVLEQAGLTVHDVSLYLLHQANKRIIDAAVQQLGIPTEKVFNNIQKYGNTSGGSVPIALDEAFAAGRVKRGDTILLSGFGAGLTWGTALFRW